MRECLTKICPLSHRADAQTTGAQTPKASASRRINGGPAAGTRPRLRKSVGVAGMLAATIMRHHATVPVQISGYAPLHSSSHERVSMMILRSRLTSQNWFAAIFVNGIEHPQARGFPGIAKTSRSQFRALSLYTDFIQVVNLSNVLYNRSVRGLRSLPWA
jgi:hypothetical protein